MNKTGFSLTDWIFFFNPSNRDDLRKIVTNPGREDIPGEFVTYKLITVYLPVVPFAIVVLLNILMNFAAPSTWFSFINNGSLPIISFGVISAGMPYLLEQLEEFPNFHIIRRRVMAVSLIFLFLTASMYIFQTISGLKLNLIINCASLLLSVYIFLFSASIGYKMFMLQSNNIRNFAEGIQGDVNGLQDALDDI